MPRVISPHARVQSALAIFCSRETEVHRLDNDVDVELKKGWPARTWVS